MVIAKNLVAELAWISTVIIDFFYSIRGIGIASRYYGEETRIRNSEPLIALWIVCSLLSIALTVLYYRKTNAMKKVISAIALAFFLIFTVLFWSQW